MKTLRLAIACLALATSMPLVLHAQNAGTDSLERALKTDIWDVDMEKGQRAWGDLRFREGHEFSTMHGPQGSWKVTGERMVEIGSMYVLDFAPGLVSFVVTQKAGGAKIATGKKMAARDTTNLSPLKTAPTSPAAVPQAPLPNPLTPAQQTANRHTQEVAAQIAKLQEPFATIAAEAEKATKDVTAAYLSALDQLQGQKAAAGDIDGVVAIKQERDRVTNNAQPTAADLQAMSAPVRKLRATYEADTKKAADEAARRHDLARRSYLANLEALQKRINAAGEIEQGLLVKAEKDRFIAELVANKAGASVTTRPTTIPVPAPNAGTARNGGTKDMFQAKSVWRADWNGVTHILTIHERTGETFRARFDVGSKIVREIKGSVKGDKVWWLAKDVHVITGSAGGDNFGTIKGDKIDFTWSGGSSGKSGEFTLIRQQPKN